MGLLVSSRRMPYLCFLLLFHELASSEFTCTALTGRDNTGDVGSLPCPLRCNVFAISLCPSTADQTYETVVAVSATSAL